MDEETKQLIRDLLEEYKDAANFWGEGPYGVDQKLVDKVQAKIDGFDYSNTY